LLSDGRKDVDCEPVRLGEVDGDKLDVGIHERGDEIDVAGEPVQFGDDEGDVEANVTPN
jgi:hypothetical protein